MNSKSIKGMTEVRIREDCIILGMFYILTDAMRCHRAHLIQQHTNADPMNSDSVAEPVVRPGGCYIN
jgi:hypothetical protein